jgi:hypothetical protein
MQVRLSLPELGITSDLLTDMQAAAYCGFVLQTFAVWVRRGLLPRPAERPSGWTSQLLNEALDRLRQLGVQHDNPKRRYAHFIKIYNCQRVWRDRQDGGGWHFYFRPTGETLPGPWGSAEFMSALIECERRYASQQPGLSAVEPRIEPGPVQGPVQPIAKEILEKLQVPCPPVLPVEFFTETEVARIFRTTLRTFREQTRGKGFHLQLGRRRLYTADDIVRLSEVLRCSSSSLPARGKARIGEFAARTSASTWTKAAELTDDPSLVPSSKTFEDKSSEANIRRESRKPRRMRRPFSVPPSPTLRPDAGPAMSPASSDTSEKSR